MEHMPPPPMGPPPGFAPNQYPADGNDWQMPGSSHLQDDCRGCSPPPFGQDFDDDWVKPKKNKNKKSGKNEPVEVLFEGYSFEPLPAEKGRTATWARVGKRTLPFDSKKLKALVEEHRRKTRSGPAYDWGQLGPKQQGIIDRLIAERKLKDKNEYADWVLVNVTRKQIQHFSRPNETLRMQVIIKRQDIEDTRIDDRKSVSMSGGYQETEIIDLSQPLSTKKPGKDRGKKKRDRNQEVDDILDGLVDPIDIGSPDMSGQQDQDQYQQQPPIAPPPMMPPPPMGPAPGMHDNYPQHPGPPPMNQHYPPNHMGHPFQPNSEFNAPGQYAAHFDDFRQGPPRARIITRPTTPQHRRRSSSARRERQLRNDISGLRDGLDEVRHKVEGWHISGGSSGGGSSQYEDDSVFSRAGGSSRDYSSSPSSVSDPPMSPHQGRRSGDRHKSDGARHEPSRHYRGDHERQRYRSPSRSHSRDRRRDRSHRYRTDRIDIQPHYNTRRHHHDEPRYSPSPPPPRPRYIPSTAPTPRLHRPQIYETTADDYPYPQRGAYIAEPSSFSPPPPQRRIKAYPEIYEPVADFDARRRDRNRERGRGVLGEDAYEIGRRDGVRDGVRDRVRRREGYFL